MSKRTTFTTCTPIPPTVPRHIVLAYLRDHSGMISLSPLVLTHHRLPKPPSHATPEEYHCAWYSITDRISYLPGVSGQVTYSVWFHDLPDGVQTRVYAPLGVNIKSRWSVGGNEPGEERKPRELGLKVPEDGLWLREDVDLKCGIGFSTFVRKKLRDSHEVLVGRMVEKAKLEEREEYNKRVRESQSTTTRDSLATSMSSDSRGPPRYSDSADAQSWAGSPPVSPPLSPPQRSPFRSLYAELPVNEVAAGKRHVPPQEMATEKSPVDERPQWY